MKKFVPSGSPGRLFGVQTPYMEIEMTLMSRLPKLSSLNSHCIIKRGLASSSLATTVPLSRNKFRETLDNGPSLDNFLSEPVDRVVLGNAKG